MRGGVWPFHALVFLGAFLLFALEPLLAKTLLPRFGGSFMVWGACMVFFQAVLLAGYAWVHVAARRLGERRYRWLHGALFAGSALWAPLLFDPNLPASGLPMFLDVFVRLLAASGPPFLALSTLSVAAQRWLASSDLPERDHPYVLYAASNLGSLLGLIAYPLAIEPLWEVKTQARVWWVGYAALLALHLLCMPRRSAQPAPAAAAAGAGEPAAPGRRRLAWFALSMAGSALLLAVTNALTFDVASVPLLWILPLAAYLLTFVVAFARRSPCPAWGGRVCFWFSLAGLLWFMLSLLRLSLPLWANLGLQLALIFWVCLHVHGTLASIRPCASGGLTTFYLLVAAGGVAGGVVVNWLAPLLGSSLWEFPAALAMAAAALALASGDVWPRRLPAASVAQALGLCAAVAAVVLGVPALAGRVPGVGDAGIFLAAALPFALLLVAAAGGAMDGGPRSWRAAAVFTVAAICLARMPGAVAGHERVEQRRNYYGIYRVFDQGGIRYLQHGTTLHGRQYLEGPKRRVPLSYYHASAPAGALLGSPMASGFRRVGMIGLGTGALTAYLAAGQSCTVYELDADNIEIAGRHFGYLDQARSQGCTLRFVVGDGRRSLGAEPEGSLDLLILDAFSSGAIPVHLLTVEAFAEYLRVLEPGGLLLAHVSNKFLDLPPVAAAAARVHGAHAAIRDNFGHVDPDADPTQWMAITRDADLHQALLGAGWRSLDTGLRPPPWTDGWSNLPGALLR